MLTRSQNRVDKPYMIEPVVHHNSDVPNSNVSSFHSSQDEDDFNRFNMDRNLERELGVLFILYFEPFYKVLFYRFLTCIPSFVSFSYGSQLGVDVCYRRPR